MKDLTVIQLWRSFENYPDLLVIRKNGEEVEYDCPIDMNNAIEEYKDMDAADFVVEYNTDEMFPLILTIEVEEPVCKKR